METTSLPRPLQTPGQPAKSASSLRRMRRTCAVCYSALRSISGSHTCRSCLTRVCADCAAATIRFSVSSGASVRGRKRRAVACVAAPRCGADVAADMLALLSRVDSKAAEECEDALARAALAASLACSKDYLPCPACDAGGFLPKACSRTLSLARLLLNWHVVWTTVLLVQILPAWVCLSGIVIAAAAVALRRAADSYVNTAGLVMLQLSCPECGHEWQQPRPGQGPLEMLMGRSAVAALPRKALQQQSSASKSEPKAPSLVGGFFDALQQLQSRAVAVLRCKPCPICGVSIVKRGGCPRMHCTRCDARFCWTCGATPEPGAYLHHRGCRPGWWMSYYILPALACGLLAIRLRLLRAAVALVLLSANCLVALLLLVTAPLWRPLAPLFGPPLAAVMQMTSPLLGPPAALTCRLATAALDFLMS